MCVNYFRMRKNEPTCERCKLRRRQLLFSPGIEIRRNKKTARFLTAHIRMTCCSTVESRRQKGSTAGETIGFAVGEVYLFSIITATFGTHALLRPAASLRSCAFARGGLLVNSAIYYGCYNSVKGISQYSTFIYDSKYLRI